MEEKYQYDLGPKSPVSPLVAAEHQDYPPRPVKTVLEEPSNRDCQNRSAPL